MRTLSFAICLSAAIAPPAPWLVELVYNICNNVPPSEVGSGNGIGGGLSKSLKLSSPSDVNPTNISPNALLTSGLSAAPVFT